MVFVDKCIFQVDQIRGGFPNQFVELKAESTRFVASANVLIGGRSRKVTNIMLYTMPWLQQCYLGPIEQLGSE